MALGYHMGQGGIIYNSKDWTSIKNVINHHMASQVIENGEKFAVILTTGNAVTFEANVNTYGLDEVDFIAYNYTSSYALASWSAGAWNTSQLRTDLNSTLFYNSLPDDLKAVISEKTLTRCINTSGSTGSASDKIWIPTEYETFGVNTYSSGGMSAYQNQYPSLNARKTRGGSTWLSDISVGSYPGICYDQNGGANCTSGGTMGVVPCFRIAPDA